MANDKAAPAFMDLPLEVRHTIFEYVAARNVKPKKLLRYWFEKKEVKALIEQKANNNPNGPTPRVVYANDSDDYDVESAVGEDDDDGEDDDEEETENVEEDSENEDEDEDEDEEAEVDEEVEEDETVGEDGDSEDEAEIEGEDAEEELDKAVDGTQPPQLATAQATAQINLNNQPADEMEEDASQVHATEDEEDDELEGIQENTGYEDDDGEAEGALADTGEEGDNDSEDEDEDEDEDLADGNGNTGLSVAATQPPPSAPVVQPHGKWRHIPNFMCLTQCPPPVQLLLTSQQLNNEAKNWFYDVATLRIDATGSFAHTSFFEEAFSQITDSAFSPMENIRKVEVTFVWDSAWIRADTSDCVEAVFPALLRQRSSFVYKILLQAPDLREVVIHWHDSARDDESTNLMLDTLTPFHTLCATIKVIEHYIAADATPRKRSVAGKRRVEFQNILDMGLDRLF